MRAPQTRWIGLWLLAVLLLAACGDDDDTNDADLNQGATGDSHITGVATGALDWDFSFANARFECRNGAGDDADVFEVNARSDDGQILMMLPVGASAGTYVLFGLDEPEAETGVGYSIAIRHDGTTYDEGDGRLTIENMPAGPLEPFTGSFVIRMPNEDGDEVSFEASFDVPSTSSAVDNCEA